MYRALENPLPRFLQTTGGKIAAATVVAAAIGAGIALAQNSAAAKTVAPGSGGAPGPTPLPGAPASFLFHLAYPSTALATPAQAVADLTAAGFTGILLQPDPTVTDAYLVAATYGPGLPYSAQVQTAVTSAPAPGSLDFSIAAPSVGAAGQAGIYNLVPIVSIAPPAVAQLVVGQWYSFSVRTSFLQSAANAQSDVLSLLQGMGFGSASSPALYVAPVTQSSPGVPLSSANSLDTWNVIAQFNGVPASTAAAPGSTQGVSDLPPLLMFVPSAMPTAITTPTVAPVPSNVMP